MIWERWRRGARPADELAPLKPFEDLLEEAPVLAMMVDARQQVVAANAAARAYFSIVAERLPAGLVEVTREGAIVDLLRAGRPTGEARLAHRQRVVTSLLVPGPAAGETLIFLTDVTEQRRLETVRQEFVANLSHELKTPITSLRLAVESLQDEPPADSRKRFAARALKETDHLAAIVDNLRQLAEIEGGSTQVRLESVELAPLVRESLERVHADRPLDLEVEPGLRLLTDRAKLAQAIGNLVDNAAKFSPPGSPVEVRAGARDQEVRITIRDHGPGISPEHWERVFERFYKIDPARTRELPGSGLGLAITKHLVLLLGGRVWTEAAPEGGQIFGIELPATHRTLVAP